MQAIAAVDSGMGDPVTGQVAGQVAGQVTQEVKALLKCMSGEMQRVQIMDALNLAGRDNFRNLYLIPALEAGLIEMTIPEKPNSRLQKYRLTAQGRTVLQVQQDKGNNQ